MRAASDARTASTSSGVARKVALASFTSSTFSSGKPATDGWN